MRGFTRVCAALALGGLIFSGCAEGGPDGVTQGSGQIPELPAGAAGNGGVDNPVPPGGAGMSGAGTSGGAGMSGAGTSGGAGTSAAGTGGAGGTAGTSSAGTGGTSGTSGTAGTSAAGSGGTAGSTAGAGGTGGMIAPAPDLFPPNTTDRTPWTENAPECPAVAPADPWGDCAGLPVYVECNYGKNTDGSAGYACICDWIHWICV